eukprot:1692769-Amphidinium_carterae.1
MMKDFFMRAGTTLPIQGSPPPHIVVLEPEPDPDPQMVQIDKVACNSVVLGPPGVLTLESVGAGGPKLTSSLARSTFHLCVMTT